MGNDQDTPIPEAGQQQPSAPTQDGASGEKTHTLTDSQFTFFADAHSSKRVAPLMSQISKMEGDVKSGQLAGIQLLQAQDRITELEGETDALRAKGDNVPPDLHEVNRQRGELRVGQKALKDGWLELNIAKQDTAELIRKGKDAGVELLERRVATEVGVDEGTLHGFGPFTSEEDMRSKAGQLKLLGVAGSTTPGATAPSAARPASFRPDGSQGGQATERLTGRAAQRAALDRAKRAVGITPSTP